MDAATTTTGLPLAGQVELTDAAADAARSAAVSIRTLGEPHDCRALAALFAEIWERPDPPVPAEVLRAVAYAGGYVAAAYDGSDVVGGSVGFLGRHGGALHLHSHITGVLPAVTGRHVGLALKLHQRAWAGAAGLAVIEWTFDPLVRRNAYFNLTKLGARMVGYEVDFYGPMADGLNAGEETDRAVVVWPVHGTPAVAQPDGDVVLSADDRGRPVPRASGASRRLAWVPEDVVALRRTDRELARAWRLALRDVLRSALNDGLAASALTRDGWYVLRGKSPA